MVNTRRMESGGSAHDSGLRYRTRRTADLNERAESASNSDSDSEESQEEESWSCPNKRKRLYSKKKKTLPSRVLELRNRFVCDDRKFRDRELRSSRKRIALNERHSVTIYSSRNMHDDSDIYNGNNTDDEIFSPRVHRSRRLRRTRATHMATIQRRTALSLRPISLKSYADPHSPLNFNTDSDGEKIDYVRRSTRKRNLQRENMSWLADGQMHKVGYPNIDAQEYSDDSCDRQDRRNTENGRNRKPLGETKRNARHSSDLSNGRHKAINEDEDTDVKARNEKQLKNRLESDSKERIEGKADHNTGFNGKIKKTKDNKEANEACDQKRNVKETRTIKVSDKEGQEEGEADEKVGDSHNNNDAEEEDADDRNEREKKKIKPVKAEERPSSDDDVKIARRRRLRTNHVLESDFSPRRTRSRKISETSSSSEVGKGYSLRDRPAKPPPKQMRSTAVHEFTKTITRRHYNRRSSPTSTSSSDSDKVCRKTDKYSKNSKNDQRMKSGPSGSKILPINPETLDSSVRFSSIGGLDGHVQCLKEMILLPMMYPDVFSQFQVQPPRGVLFYGPPGTGKTLIARALANECSFGSRKVSFFMRKGADLLSKWIGESEKQLRLLFEQAADMKPSIIFFDELDGLAPVRSSRQDQVHASIVSTLLALMDGLDNRGEVIVIGATNRIDAIDPALRRPGRFDRELFFPLPSRKEREEILKVHVSQWRRSPDEKLISYLAENTVGYCGSDVRALCTEAVIQGFRRKYPQVYSSEHRLLLDPESVMVEKIDFLRAKSLLVPASHRINQNLSRKLMPLVEPILSEPYKDILNILGKSFPHGLNQSLTKVKLSANLKPAQLLLLGNGPEHGQTSYLAPAVLYHMEHIRSHVLDLSTLFRETGRSPEEACIQVFSEAKRNVPSIIYIPAINNLWQLSSDTLKSIFISELMQFDPNSPVLLLATAHTVFSDLPREIQKIFSQYRQEVYELNTPNYNRRKSFFKPLLIDNCLKPPRLVREKSTTPPILPRAPTPPPIPLSEEQASKLYEQEERTLRELRIFLRDMCKKLANNRLFYMFTKPVDTEEVPDYTTIIKQPMDLETMMTKVDFHRYECAKDFLSDIELICQNALEYNPAKTSADKQIRHRACSLRDYAYTLIKNEMDSDFEEKCQDISKRRRNRKASISKYLPAYIQTPADEKLLFEVTLTSYTNNEKIDLVKNENFNSNMSTDSGKNENSNGGFSNNTRSSPSRKRKVPSWQRGFVSSKRRKQKNKRDEQTENVGENEEKSSADECKENKLESASVEQENQTLTVLVDENHDIKDCRLSRSPLANSVGVNYTNSFGHAKSSTTKRCLSQLQSPSELLDDTLDFDDIDQALNEEVEDGMKNKQPVIIHKSDLEKLLDKIADITVNHSLQSLLDLHSQLSKVIKEYSKTPNRENLPKELHEEFERFKKEIASCEEDKSTA